MSMAFSWNRLLHLIEVDIALRYRSLITVAVTLVSVMLVSDWLTERPGDPVHLYRFWFFSILTIWGPIAASASFRELHDKTRNSFYLLLPASALEKTTARLLLVLVGLTAYVLAIVTAASMLAQLANASVSGAPRSIFTPLDAAAWKVIPQCIALESLYFLGAAWFRRTHFVKTTLTITLVVVGLVLVAGVVLRFTLGSDFFVLNDIGDRSEQIYRANRGAIEALGASLRTLYFVGLPVLCGAIAWMRVSETQVSDGV